MNRRTRGFLIGMMMLLGVMSYGEEDKAIGGRIVERFYTAQKMGSDQSRILENMMVKQEITTLSSSGETRGVSVVFFKNPDVALCYFRGSKGEEVVFLYHERNAWIYKDGLRTPIKVSLSQQVMGDANLGDVLGINVLRDFEFSSLENTGEGLVLNYVKKPASTYPYPVVQLHVDTEERIRQIWYGGAGGEFIRVADLDNYRLVAGDHLVPDWTIRNVKMHTDRKTILRYVTIRELSLPDSFFRADANALAQFMKWAKRYL